VDFFCPAANLVVEIDGRTHIGRAGVDAARTRYFEKQGYRVIRFADDEVIQDLDPVVAAIAVAAGVNA
jgi:very-short-patch-repair endonuclease